MFTAQNIFDMAMDLMDERLSTGEIDENSTEIYAKRAPGILTMWQNEAADGGDLYKTLEIDRRPIQNMFGFNGGLDVVEVSGADVSKECLGGAKAYSFEVNGGCTVYIEDFTGGWNALATIVVPDTVVSFTNYKGTVTPTSGANKSRIRFSGDYYYLATNYALYSSPFRDAAAVPKYGAWVKYEMPSDFKSVDTIVDEYPRGNYSHDTAFKWEGRRDLYVSYNYTGKIRIVYKPVPAPITDLSQTLEVDEIMSMSGAYFLAAHLALTDDPNIASFFNERYMETIRSAPKRRKAQYTDIIDAYGTGCIQWR